MTPDRQPETVHLVFKTHLDIGFTDHAAAVRRQYHDRFIPQALSTAEHFWREDPERPKFVWTTGAWLIHDHLEVADAAARRRLETAIGRGLIRWHGLPFTTHSELMSPTVFRAGLSYSADLDRRFGTVTRAAKMTDVPGHTLGIVPLMAEAGLRFLHLGVNSASPMPDLPDVFRWRAQGGAEIVVMYQPSYGALHLPDGMTDALSFAHTHDNIGPQTAAQTLDAWHEAEAAAPGAAIRAATLEDYADLLWARRAELPVWEGEIGDSWIYGAGSDPAKLARFLAMQRVYDALEADGAAPGRLRLGRSLAMVAEHTWGVDIKTWLPETQSWDRAALERARVEDPRFRFAEDSWAEQRGFLDEGLAALSPHDRACIEAALPQPAPAPLTGTAPETVGGWRIEVDPLTGDVFALTDPDGLCIRGAPLLSFRHASYDAADIARHMDSYLTDRPDWAILDHGKPGLEDASTARSEVSVPQSATLSGSDGVLEILCDMPGDAVAARGCPARMRWRFSARDGALETALILDGKAANRMPEAGFLTISPGGATDWRLTKTGLEIDPRTCPRRGGGALHAVSTLRVDGGGDGAAGISLNLLDSALVMPEGQDFMAYPQDPPAWDKGATIVLYNNKWGTNFPMWWSGDLVSRFRLRLVPKGR